MLVISIVSLIGQTLNYMIRYERKNESLFDREIMKTNKKGNCVIEQWRDISVSAI